MKLCTHLGVVVFGHLFKKSPRGFTHIILEQDAGYSYGDVGHMGSPLTLTINMRTLDHQCFCATPSNATIDLNKGYQKCIWSLLDIRKQQNKITPKPAQEETFEAGTTL